MKFFNEYSICFIYIFQSVVWLHSFHHFRKKPICSPKCLMMKNKQTKRRATISAHLANDISVLNMNFRFSTSLPDTAFHSQQLLLHEFGEMSLKQLLKQMLMVGHRLLPGCCPMTCCLPSRCPNAIPGWWSFSLSPCQRNQLINAISNDPHGNKLAGWLIELRRLQLTSINCI